MNFVFILLLVMPVYGGDVSTMVQTQSQRQCDALKSRVASDLMFHQKNVGACGPGVGRILPGHWGFTVDADDGVYGKMKFFTSTEDRAGCVSLQFAAWLKTKDGSAVVSPCTWEPRP